MPSYIKAGKLLTERQQREVRAALNLLGLDQQTLAKKENVSVSRLNRVVNGREVPSPAYAALLERTLSRAARTSPFSRAAA